MIILFRQLSKRLLCLIFIFSGFFFTQVQGESFQEKLNKFKLPKFKHGDLFEKGSFEDFSVSYGNKTANLCVLHAMTHDINKELEELKSDFVLEVPKFFALSHEVIKKYLDINFKGKIGDEVDVSFAEKWQEFITKQLGFIDKQKKQKKEQGLDPEAIMILKEIQEGIKEIFDVSSEQEILERFGEEKLSEEKQGVVEQIRDFLEVLQKTGKHDVLLMVRSTGREDTKNLANAGGNESVSSVLPELVEIWHAIGEVIGSYFGDKSFSQRLISTISAAKNEMGITAGKMAADQENKIIDKIKYEIKKDPFVPVLLQYMIGERVWTGHQPDEKEIPVSGVIFTQEPEGNTTGVSVIQAAYGNNTGVVNSLIPVDTFYIAQAFEGKTALIHPIIRIKTKRLVSMESKKTEQKFGKKYELDFVDNSKKMQEEPTLNPGVVLDLKKIVEVVERIYDYPTDIEFVVSKSEKKIYFVQSRPIVQRRQERVQDYLSDAYLDEREEQEKKDNKSYIVKGESLGIAGGYVYEIENEDYVIMADTLPQALIIYNGSGSRDTIKAVIVKEMAPSTSHEATTFRSYGIPVIVVSVDQSVIVKAWFSGVQTILLFDTQRALLVKGDQDVVKKLQSKETRKEIIVEGWYTHPIPMKTSLLHVFLKSFFVNNEEEFKKKFLELTWDKEKDRDNKKDSIKHLFKFIKSSNDKKEFTEVLKRIVHRVSSLIKPENRKKILQKFFLEFEKRKKESEKEEILQKLKTSMRDVILNEVELVYLGIMLSASEILQTFELEKSFKEIKKLSDKQIRLLRLYSIKFLEAIVYQQAKRDIVSAPSYVQLLKTYKEEIGALSKITEKFSPVTESYITQFMKADKLILRDDMKKNWQDFLNGIAKIRVPGKRHLEQWKIKSDVVKGLGYVVAQLQKLGALHLWLNSSFKKIWDKNKDKKESERSYECAKNMVKDFKADSEIIKWVQEKQYIVDTWSGKIEDWSDPNNFEKDLFPKFEKQFLSTFIMGAENSEIRTAFNKLMFVGGRLVKSGEDEIAPLDYGKLKNFTAKHAPFTIKFNKAKELGKLILSIFLKKIVDVYDGTIKGVTGSPHYKEKKQDQVKNFATLLVGYISLMEQCVATIDDEKKEMEKKLMLIVTRPGWDWPFERYLKEIRQIFLELFAKKDQDASDLKATSTFSVAAAQIGSKVDFGRVRPFTYEDLFTLMHQNILVMIATVNEKFGIPFSMLPDLLQKISLALGNIEIAVFSDAPPYKVTRIGIDYQYPVIHVYYNLPLRQHSATFTLSYDCFQKKEQAILTSVFMGHNESNRMYGIAGYANLAAFASGFVFAKVPEIKGAEAGKNVGLVTTFSWILDKKSDFEILVKYLNRFANATLAFTSDPIYMISEVNKICRKKLGVGFEGRADDVESKDVFNYFNKLKNLPEQFFSNDLFFNLFFTHVFLNMGNFDKAFKIIRLSLLKDTRLNYPINEGKGLSSIDFHKANGLLCKYFILILQKQKDPEAVAKAVSIVSELLQDKRFDDQKMNLLKFLFDSGKVDRRFIKDELSAFMREIKIPDKIWLWRKVYKDVLWLMERFFTVAEIRTFIRGLYDVELPEQRVKDFVVNAKKSFVKNKISGEFSQLLPLIKKKARFNKKRVIDVAYRDLAFFLMNERKIKSVKEIALELINKRVAYGQVFKIAERSIKSAGQDLQMYKLAADIGNALKVAHGVYKRPLYSEEVPESELYTPWRIIYLLTEDKDFQEEKALKIKKLLMKKIKELKRAGNTKLAEQISALLFNRY
ncbi:hypothetical protein KAT08_01100 [Candidatus Babeliales bacterium]|nr:hypothetical protein [Candidatus Babeliales bacterium]